MRTVIFIILLFLFAGQLYSSQVDNSQVNIDINAPLTLKDCITVALQNSSSMKIADLDLRTSQLDLADARAYYWPEINANGQYRFSDRIDFGWERQNYDAQMAVSYTIWDHGRREARLAQAKADDKGVQANYHRSKQNLVFNVTKAYYDLLQTEKLIDIQENLLEISKVNVDKAKAFEEKGKSIPADVAAAKVQQANYELALINAINNLDLARSRLASLMGLDPSKPITLEEDPEFQIYLEANLLTPEVSLEDSLLKAMKNRPELKSLQANMTSLEWYLKLARINRWPVLTAEFSYNFLLDDYLRDRENFKKYRNWGVLARVTFPIFDSGSSMRREKSAEIAIEQLKENINEQEISIILEIQEAYLNLEQTRKNLEIASEQVKNATLSLEATQGRYEQNMIIFLEVLSSQTRYAEALINQVRAFYSYQMSNKSLLKAMGIL